MNINDHAGDADHYRRPRCFFRKLSTTEALAYPSVDRDAGRIHTGIQTSNWHSPYPYTILLDGCRVVFMAAGAPNLQHVFDTTFQAGTAAASIARSIGRAPGILCYFPETVSEAVGNIRHSTVDLLDEMLKENLENSPAMRSMCKTVAQAWCKLRGIPYPDDDPTPNTDG